MVCSKTTKNCKSGHEASWGAWGARAHPEKQGEEPVVGSKGGRESPYTAVSSALQSTSAGEPSRPPCFILNEASVC